jgi:hypothetical protein
MTVVVLSPAATCLSVCWSSVGIGTVPAPLHFLQVIVGRMESGIITEPSFPVNHYFDLLCRRCRDFGFNEVVALVDMRVGSAGYRAGRPVQISGRVADLLDRTANAKPVVLP